MPHIVLIHLKRPAAKLTPTIPGIPISGHNALNTCGVQDLFACIPLAIAMFSGGAAKNY